MGHTLLNVVGNACVWYNKFMIKLKPTQASYLAGLIDGDGCISISHQYKRGDDFYSVVCRIENTSESLLKWCLDTTGIGNLKNSPHLNTNWNRPNVKPMYKWTVCPNELREFLPQIEPYLILKKERAKITIEWLEKTKKNTGRRINDELRKWKRENCAVMQRLNKRGIST